jgi:hypothetical protein
MLCRSRAVHSDYLVAVEVVDGRSGVHSGYLVAVVAVVLVRFGGCAKGPLVLLVRVPLDTPQVLDSTPRVSEFQVEVKKIPSSVPYPKHWGTLAQFPLGRQKATV